MSAPCAGHANVYFAAVRERVEEEEEEWIGGGVEEAWRGAFIRTLDLSATNVIVAREKLPP